MAVQPIYARGVITCRWFDNSKKLHAALFADEELEKAS
jgi:hypothetical protein